MLRLPLRADDLGSFLAVWRHQHLLSVNKHNCPTVYFWIIMLNCAEEVQVFMELTAFVRV